MQKKLLKYPILFAILSFVLTTMTQSCATFSFYHPEKSFHPLIQKEKDIQVEGGAYATDQFSGFLLQGAYGLEKSRFLYFSSDLSSQTTAYKNVNVFGGDSMVRKNLDIKQQSGHFRLGYGFYKPISGRFFYGAQGALGIGSIQYTSFDVDNNRYQNAVRKVGNMNAIVGGFIRYSGKYLDFSFAPNIYTTTFTNVIDQAFISRGTSYEYDMVGIQNGDIYAFLEPSFQLNAGLKNIKVFLNLTPSYALGKLPFKADTGNFSFGIVAKLHKKEAIKNDNIQ